MNTHPDVALVTWPVSLPLETLELGPALTEAQRVIEATVGVTSEILHAYARALPRLMGAWLRRPVHPLGFGRGSLVAVATSVPVDLPGLRYVQTSSPLVCRELGAAVPLFHVDNKECLLALRERGGAVTRVWVERVLPFEFDAPFEVIFHKPRYRAPVWRARTAPDHLALLADLDDDRTFAWDRDLGGEVVYDYDRDVTHDASAATLDVAPHPNPPPWSPLEAFAIAGAGWAATCLQRPSRDGDRVRATEDRRWLLLHAFPSHDVLDGLAQRWEARRDTRALLAGTNAYVVGCALELTDDAATVRWLGHHRVLRLRDGALEQLTTDHSPTRDPAFARRFSPEERGALAQYDNVVTRALGTHEFSSRTTALRPGDRFVLLSSDAHGRLLALAGDALAERLGLGSAKAAARAIATWLTRDGGRREPVVIVDHDARVVHARWRHDASPVRCVVDDSVSDWRLLASGDARPHEWPEHWLQMIRRQHEAGALLPAAPAEGQLLVLDRVAQLRWRDGAWHPVRVASPGATLLQGRLETRDSDAVSVVTGETIEQRARAAEDAGFALAAAWLRSCAHPRGALHESLSPRLSARSRRALAGSHWVREVRARDLMEHPRRYHGWRVRARGVLSLGVERSRFADAWLRGDHGLGPGIWLVEVTGTWSSDPARRYGHLGMYKSELAGVVRALATSSPRRVDPERVRFARPYVPLSAELIVRRYLQGWTIDGAFVSRMAGCPRLDEPAWPDECAMELCLARDAFGNLGVLDWRIVGAPTPLTPRALAPGDVGRVGELVELTGLLRSGDRGGWPVLGDALKVVPPPISRAADRHALPQPELHARLAAQLGAGVEARAIGEFGRRGEVLYAIELHGPRGPITSAR